MAVDGLERVDEEIDRITLGAGQKVGLTASLPHRFQNVVVAVDGRPASSDALVWAAWLGTEEAAKVHLVHAIGPLPQSYDTGGVAPQYGNITSWGELLAEEQEQAEGLLRSARDELRRQGVHATTETGIGSPARVVAKLAADRGADLVVCGARSASPLERVFLGSVADGIKNLVPCAALIAKQPPSARPVLLPTDGSEPSRRAAFIGAHLAGRLGADAHILHVIPAGSRGATALSQKGYHEALRAAEEAGAARAAPDALPDHITSEVAFGQPHEVIEDQAKRMDAGLVVMGSRGLGGIRGRMLGSVSNPVSHRVKSSLLFIKPQD